MGRDNEIVGQCHGSPVNLRLRAILLIGALLLAGPALGDTGPAVSADMPASAWGPASRAKVLTVDVHVAPNGTSVQTSHAEILATNAAAAMQAGQIRNFYDSSTQTLRLVEAYTLKKDGRKIPVAADAVYDQLAPGAAELPLYSDLHMSTIIFPQFEAGDTAIYTLETTVKQPYFPSAYWYVDVYPQIVAFDDVRETVTAPSSLQLKVDSYGMSVNQQTHGEDTVFTWHYSAPDPKKPKIVAVSQIASTPHVFLSSFSDYAALGRAYAEGAASKMDVTQKIQTLADTITKDETDKRERARKLYEWVTGHVRYVAVEFGRGSLVPHDAETVLNNGYGDCKDHVTLLGALLKAEGIRSEAVLINADNDYTLTGVPTLVGLDHVITYLPDFNIYVDSSSLVAPFGVLPLQEYGKPIVFAELSNARRGILPVLRAGVAKASMKTDSSLSADGVLTGTTITTANGPYSILLRFAGVLAQRVGPEAAAAKIMSTLGYGNDATGTLVVPPPMVLGPSYSTNGSFIAPHWKDQLGRGNTFNIPGGMRLLGFLGNEVMGEFGSDDLAPDAERPCYSVLTTEEETLHIPENMKFSRKPNDTHIETHYLTFNAHWTLNGNTLSVLRVFDSHIEQPLCTPEIRKANEAALKGIMDNYNTNLSIESGAYNPADSE